MTVSTRFVASFALALAALLVLPPLAQAQQKLLPAQSEISFVSRQMGSPVEGRFRSFDAQVALDPKQLAAAKIVLVVDLASVTLASTDGLKQHHTKSGSPHEHRRIQCRCRKSPVLATIGHTTDKHATIAGQIIHADAIAE
jgi:hypothetical protein